jgi:hypothetical protein
MNSTTYWWQGAYECAVLETNPARMATLIDDAFYAIEQRVGSTIRMDQAENEAIESARNGLAVMRGEWFADLAESMTSTIGITRTTTIGMTAKTKLGGHTNPTTT